MEWAGTPQEYLSDEEPILSPPLRYTRRVIKTNLCGHPCIRERPQSNQENTMIKGFRDFILRGNVMDLAVAVIIGAAFTAIVTSFTANIINPLLGAIVGKPNFDYLVAYVNGGQIKYGTFLTAVVNFLLVAGVVYFLLVVPTQYLMKKYNPPAAEPVTTKPCPQCLGEIPLAATRCKFCTQPV